MYKLCVMGNPVHHSKSPWIHQQFANQASLAISYSKIQPELNGFNAAAAAFRAEGGHGFNITIPFKMEAYAYADLHSKRAELAGAVNTILFTANREIYGDNTDGIGLVIDITQNKGYSLQDKRILILGAGGAVRGILGPLLACKPKQICIANRTVATAHALAALFQAHGNIIGCGLDELADLTVDVIIDGTGFGVNLTLPASLQLSPNSLCYDLKYAAHPTPFMALCGTKGASLIADGKGMLVEQAAEAFYLWTGFRPRTLEVIQAFNIQVNND